MSDATYNIKMGTARRGERGQVAVLFALIFTFMFVLFAMVVDIAHLVNNKINLQLAADAAAYAGAAYQARTLNQISAINYRMRQDIKELAMRLHVTHMRHNRNYPRGTRFIQGAPGFPDVDGFICQQAHGYVSLSGVTYNNDTNLCRNASGATGGLPPILVPPVIASFDPFQVAIAAQIRRIAEKADQQCAAAANDNQALATHLAQKYIARGRFHRSQLDELKNFLNATPAGQPVSDAETHPIAKVALESFRRNLTPSNASNAELIILQPRRNDDDSFIGFDDINLNASILYTNFQVRGGSCVGEYGFADDLNIPAGVSKKRNIITYFAVRAKSVPNLLFIPRRWLDDNFPQLFAYSAAKPFGSRIGPEGTIDQKMPVPGRPGNNSRIVNFSFFPGDTLGMQNQKIMALFDAYHPLNTAFRPEGNRERGWPEPNNTTNNFSLALRAIHAPTVFDALFYTVFPDPSSASDYAEPQFAEALYPDYLEAYDPANRSVAQQPTPTTAPYLQGFLSAQAGRGPGWIRVDALPAESGAYNNYGDEAPESHGTQLAVGLPFITEDSAREFGFATRDLVNSAWRPDGKRGRIGYSVKFIGMEPLTGKLFVNSPGGGQEPIFNIPQAPDGDPNIRQVVH